MSIREIPKIIEDAKLFAIAAHEAVGQRRKYTNEPYWVHPKEVADIVSSVDHTKEMLAAAWLHDVVEDTHITQELIHNVFGGTVAELVYWLTDISRPGQGNRAARKTIDKQHTAEAPAKAQTIKLADLISNTRTIVMYDKDFAKVYLEEKRLLLEVLKRGNSALFYRAAQQI